MTLRPLSEIKLLRKKHDLSQKELSKLSGVSQSLIAKIESQKVEPTYTKVQSLFETLDRYQEKKELYAKNVMFKKVISVKINEKINLVKEIMTKKNISQLPVFYKGNVCGLITETDLIKSIGNNNVHVGDIMSDAPPIVSVNTKISTIQQILQNSPIILITEKGEIKGLITKTDLLKKI